MKKVLEYTAIVLVILSLIITFIVDRKDKYDLGSINDYPVVQDSCKVINENVNDINILDQINTIDSIVDTQKGVNNKMFIKTKKYKDSVNLLKVNIQKERDFYAKQKKELEDDKKTLQIEKESINVKYNEEHQLNQVYSNSIIQMRDSLILSDSLLKSKKKPK